jgi:hypothetical protein
VPSAAAGATAAAPDWLTLQLASANLLNLALPDRISYANQDPYTPAA